MIHEQIGLEGGVEFLEKTVSHRCVGETEFSHRTHIGLGETLVVNEIVIKRRHQIEIGDFMGSNQFQRFRGIETWQANKDATYQGHRSEERRVGKECRSRWSPY